MSGAKEKEFGENRISEKLSRERVKGFLHREGRKLVNGEGQELILAGWGLGNWLLQEGYMWGSGSPRFDRPRRIEGAVAELTGHRYADVFWQRFRDCYITEADILRLAEEGYNSVRLPFNWRLFLEEEPGLIWKEEGFRRLEDCARWCEKAGVYLFLDMHGAPGGQTGSNIDDSYDNVPRLFIDRQFREKALAIWERLAQIYCDREVIGGYDLLNEPIIPKEAAGKDYDYLLPELKSFYEECIQLIRKKDKNHLISIESEHWSTGLEVFDRVYDDNMVMHFHRYAELPQKQSMEAYIRRAEELDLPLWMGETGENLNEWYSAFYPLALRLNIGVNLWPWKKLDCTNSVCSVKRPEGWDKVLDYLQGGPHPGYWEAQKIFNDYLENIRFENCVLRGEVTDAVFRRNSFSLRATDFDENIEGQEAYCCLHPYEGQLRCGNGDTSSEDAAAVLNRYRADTGFELIAVEEERPARFGFDCKWDRFALPLRSGEWVSYWVMETKGGCILELFGSSENGAGIEIWMGEQLICEMEAESGDGYRRLGEATLPCGQEYRLIIKVTCGELALSRLLFQGGIDCG